MIASIWFTSFTCGPYTCPAFFPEIIDSHAPAILTPIMVVTLTNFRLRAVSGERP